MKDTKNFIESYNVFRNSVDFEKSGILPELDNLIWCMLMGVPEVPADNDTSSEASFKAIEQRVAILKAIFVEVNKDRTDDFLDQGLVRYDEAGKIARVLLKEQSSASKAD